MPSIARDVLKVGADGLGVMTGVGRFGGLVGIFVLSTLVRTQNRGSVYLGAIFFFGILIVLLGRVPSFPMALGLLAVINAMMSVTDVLSQSLIQLSVPNELRGRAVGSWTLAVGSGPVGTMQIGALASFAGAAVALAANGMLLVAVAGIMLVIAPSIRRI
jgi:sugar phosphate permease